MSALHGIEKSKFRRFQNEEVDGRLCFIACVSYEDVYILVLLVA